MLPLGSDPRRVRAAVRTRAAGRGEGVRPLTRSRVCATVPPSRSPSNTSVLDNGQGSSTNSPMPTTGQGGHRVTGREALLEAAAVLMDEQGIDHVSLNEINRASGNKNRSAVSYHFGSRDAIVHELVARGMAAADAERQAALDHLEQIGTKITPRMGLELMLGPLARRLETLDGRRYLRLCGQLPNHPRYVADTRDMLFVADGVAEQGPQPRPQGPSQARPHHADAPEQQGQELWPRSQRREQGTAGGEWSAGTGLSSRRVQRRGKRSRRGHRLSDGMSLDEVDVGNRDLSRQKTSGRRNASFPPPTSPIQRPRWRMGRASGATQTTVVHDGVHRSEVEDMNRWRWMVGEGGKRRRIKSSRGWSGMW